MTFTARFFRYHQPSEATFNSVEGAVEFLAEGSNDNYLAARDVLGPDGQVVLDEAQPRRASRRPSKNGTTWSDFPHSRPASPTTAGTLPVWQSGWVCRRTARTSARKASRSWWTPGSCR